MRRLPSAATICWIDSVLPSCSPPICGKGGSHRPGKIDSFSKLRRGCQHFRGGDPARKCWHPRRSLLNESIFPGRWLPPFPQMGGEQEGRTESIQQIVAADGSRRILYAAKMAPTDVGGYLSVKT